MSNVRRLSGTNSKEKLLLDAVYDSGRSQEIVAKQAQYAIDSLEEMKVEGLNSQDLVNLAYTFNQTSHYDKAEYYADLALQKLKQENLPPVASEFIRINCALTLANSQRERGNIEQALAVYKQAWMQNTILLAEVKKQAYDLNRNLGVTYLKQGAFKNAAEHFKIAADNARESKEDCNARYLATQAYFLLALVRGEKRKADLQALEALEPLFPDHKNLDYMAYCNHLGIANQTMEFYEKAEKWFRKALRLRLTIDSNKIGTYYFHSRVGDTRYGLGSVLIYQKKLVKIREGEAVLKAASENYRAMVPSPDAAEKMGIIISLLETIPQRLNKATQYNFGNRLFSWSARAKINIENGISIADVEYSELDAFIKKPTQNCTEDELNCGLVKLISVLRNKPAVVLKILISDRLPPAFILEDLADKLRYRDQIAEISILFDKYLNEIVKKCINNQYDFKMCVAIVPQYTTQIIEHLRSTKDLVGRVPEPILMELEEKMLLKGPRI